MKTYLRDLRPGPTHTGLYNHRRWLEDSEEMGLYFLCSANKGADQLYGDRTADLRIRFLHMYQSGFLKARMK